MYQTDTDICLDAIRTARVELSRFINPFDSGDALEVLDRIIGLLDSEEVDAALHRIDARRHFRVMDFDYHREAAP